MEKLQEISRVAQDLYGQETDWATFFREILGVGGIVRRTYPEPEALAQFEKTAEYAEIQQMLAKLRERNAQRPVPQEPTRVITVRLPKSLHELLRDEAHKAHTSMNQLCISKLLQMVDDLLVPADA